MRRYVRSACRADSLRHFTLEKPNVSFQPIRGGYLIIVQKEHISSLRPRQRGISSAGNTWPPLHFVSNPRAVLLESLRLPLSFVDRAIIDDQQFRLRGELRKNTFNGLHQTFATIARANRHRYQQSPTFHMIGLLFQIHAVD
jgi:hypothetical protein